ncbi:MAG: response regulator [Candidatus Synoicihabitans palmerolidicus]|nr:response regulator [Candidatus Synoicihabitans palmerolidicus]MCC5022137.1 response regulator [Candidatus Synoicihabitans palmerolidicus]
MLPSITMSTLLLIDDDEGLRMMLGEIFTDDGYRVITDDDGEKSLRLARAHHPDIIVSDIRMPGMNGHEALTELRKSPGLEQTPVILMTGDADLPDMRKGMTGGADDYLPKPFDNLELLRIVRQHLNTWSVAKNASPRPPANCKPCAATSAPCSQRT